MADLSRRSPSEESRMEELAAALDAHDSPRPERRKRKRGRKGGRADPPEVFSCPAMSSTRCARCLPALHLWIVCNSWETTAVRWDTCAWCVVLLMSIVYVELHSGCAEQPSPLSRGRRPLRRLRPITFSVTSIADAVFLFLLGPGHSARRNGCVMVETLCERVTFCSLST